MEQPALITFALLAAVLYAGHGAANKYLFQTGLGGVPAAILVPTAAGMMAVPLLFFCDTHWVPATTKHVLWLCAVSAPTFFMATYSYSREDASVVGPVINVKIVALPFVEGLLFGKALGTGVWIGAALSAAGIALVSQTDRWTLKPALLLRPGVLMMAGAGTVFAVGDVVIGDAIRHWPDSWQFTILMNALFGVIGLIVLGVMRAVRGRTRMREGAFRMDAAALRQAAVPLAVSGAAILVAQLVLFESFARGGNVTLSNILYNTRALFIVGLMALLVLGVRSRVEKAGWRAYACRASGAGLLLLAIWVALAGR